MAFLLQRSVNQVTSSPKQLALRLLLLTFLFLWMAPIDAKNSFWSRFTGRNSKRTDLCTGRLPPLAQSTASNYSPLFPHIDAFRDLPFDKREVAWVECALISLENHVHKSEIRKKSKSSAFSKFTSKISTAFFALKSPFLGHKKKRPHLTYGDGWINRGGEGYVYNGVWNHPQKETTSPPMDVVIKKIPKKDIKEIPKKDIEGISNVSMSDSEAPLPIKHQFFLIQEIMITLIAYATVPSGVIRILDIILDDPEYWYIIMEKAQGDLFSLFETPEDLKRFSPSDHDISEPIQEHVARSVFKNVFTTLSVLNGKEIVHRDIKPENLLYFCTDRSCSVKITDFSFAVKGFDKLDKVPFRGTPEYLPRCILEGDCNNKRHKETVDVYGLLATLDDFLSYPVQPGTENGPRDRFKYLDRDWKNISYRKRPISQELITLRRLVLNDYFWTFFPMSFQELRGPIEKWFNADLRHNHPAKF
ncbi:MAG: kinase-like domain-containing protein [Piptocephalis tieghemiana]|nr:MAG: kinase-like domain-containing protein [Piptocephalis tieghemiana]